MPAVCTIRIPNSKELLTVSPKLAYRLLHYKVVSKIQDGQFQAHDFDVFWSTMKKMNK